MYRSKRLDLVSVATPDNLHVDPAVKATESGTHVLVGKPIAITLEDADRITTSVARNNVKLLVNFILRFDPRCRVAYEFVSSGCIGDVMTMQDGRTTLLETARKYGKFSNLLYDVIIHEIDMFNLMSQSEPCQAYCVRVRRACRELGVDDPYLGILRHTNGAAASFETSWILPTSSLYWLDARLHIIGTAGAIYIDLQSHGLEVVEDVKLLKTRPF